MATDKRFSVTGSSIFNGRTKIRFATDGARVKKLVKDGHTEIDLIDLPREMTKAEIAQYLNEIGFGATRPAVVAAIQDLARKNKVSLSSGTQQATDEMSDVTAVAA
jgi:hypothetical protein